ncbi:MAG: mechanosensitive ion channel [Alphaproteobacteria bacterium]|nr:mechanosensitive ion channel [Alphaproteobacteria bacterium]
MAGGMETVGWPERIAMGLENEAMHDISMLPTTPAALAREWRSFDRHGSALGALVNFGWVLLAAAIAVTAERLVAWGLSRRLRRMLRRRPEGRTLGALLLLLLCDIAGLAVFAGVFVYSRHWLMALGASMNIVLFAAAVLIRWRFAVLVVRVVLRPGEAAARLVEIGSDAARRLTRFLSAAFLGVVVLIGFGRYGLGDEDSGASHIIGLIVAILVCGLDILIIFRARGAAEALIRGYSTTGLIAVIRGAIARAWLAMGLIAVAGLLAFFVFGLSLGLLSYYHGVVSTLGVLLVLLVFERLTERTWRSSDRLLGSAEATEERLAARGCHRILRAGVLLGAGLTLAWIWVNATGAPAPEAAHAMHSAAAALGTLFAAYVVWELIRLTVDRHLLGSSGRPRLPNAAEDDEATAPASRLQTILPMVRMGFGVAIGLVATLIVLSRLGVDTAPLIAGAGVFGLAVSFGSQSLVRDIISGVFYMWDDAFRVGEYIDTGRLKGAVETLGVRSVKLRHHNGPLHTVPYGQLGAVTNLSRDFATTKFNLRLEPGTDIELVRKTAKQIGLAMQANPEIAAEVILPLKMQGIAEVADGAIVVRFKFTARPVKPSWVQREYLKRMYLLFRDKGIVFASGALTLQAGPMPNIGQDALSMPTSIRPETAAAEMAVSATASSRVA